MSETPKIDQDERSLFSMIVDLIVACPEGAREWDYQTADRTLLAAGARLRGAVLKYDWSGLEKTARLDRFQKIADELKGGDFAAQIAAESLEWAIFNHRAQQMRQEHTDHTLSGLIGKMRKSQ
jgi:hypothetical protein